MSEFGYKYIIYYISLKTQHKVSMERVKLVSFEGGSHERRHIYSSKER